MAHEDQLTAREDLLMTREHSRMVFIAGSCLLCIQGFIISDRYLATGNPVPAFVIMCKVLFCTLTGFDSSHASLSNVTLYVDYAERMLQLLLRSLTWLYFQMKVY